VRKGTEVWRQGTETSDRGQRAGDKEQRRQTGDIVFFTFYSQETWAVAKTKENAILVEKPQLGKKPADVKKAANLQNLAARYYSRTPKD
jgi:hypothetical protein